MYPNTLFEPLQTELVGWQGLTLISVITQTPKWYGRFYADIELMKRGFTSSIFYGEYIPSDSSYATCTGSISFVNPSSNQIVTVITVRQSEIDF